MNNSADSGDILSQEEIIITSHDDARTLYDKVVQTAMAQIAKFLPQLAKGNFPRIKQNNLLANVWRKRGYADGQIDWRMSAQSIHNLVRGLSLPYAGAHFLLDGKEIKVWKTVIILDDIKNYEPGKVISRTSGGVVIKCGVDSIELLDTEPKLKGNIGDYL
jgi:methionyl-tRNA formyltransferase